MMNLTARTANVARAAKRTFATAAPRIGDTKVKMSPLEESNFINYQRIEDNLAVVRKRCVRASRFGVPTSLLTCCMGACPSQA